MKVIDIDGLLVAAGAWEKNQSLDNVMDKFSDSLYEEFQNMTLEEFKKHIRHKVMLEKHSNEIVVTFGFEIIKP
ncbi:hypothetical protein ACP3VS_22070 [Lysinibacillus sp. VIII_CA]|uniref:hypothetical protein n=1 Tax=Lysinibacillus sp. VIII_CA TaxID=3417452 RepID=UPI003CF23D4A